MLFAHYALRSLVARLRANLLSALAIALFVAAASMGLAYYLTLRNVVVERVPPDRVVVMYETASDEASSRMELDIARRIMAVPGIKTRGNTPLATREIVLQVYLEREEEHDYEPTVWIRGIDDMSMTLHAAKVVEGTAPHPGANEAMVGAALAKRHPQVRIGRDLPLPRGALHITGMFTTGSPKENEIWAPRDTVEKNMRAPITSSVTLEAENPDELIQKINDSRDLEMVHAMTVTEYYAKTANLTEILRIVEVVLALLSIVAIIAIAMTMRAAVTARIPEFATLAAIGVRRGQLSRLVLAETTVLALVGAALGIGIGEVVRRTVATVPLGLYPIDVTSLPLLTMVALGLGVAILVGLLGGIAPAITVRRLDIMESLR